MNLEQMLEILKLKCGDYERTNLEIIKTLNLSTTRPMKDYMEQIKHDPLLWFKSFPMDYASTEALAKPKTGLLFLLEKNEAVKNELGKEFCESLANALHTTWKKHKQELLNVRVALKDSSSDKNMSVPKSTIQNNTRINDRIQELEKDKETIQNYLDEADEKIKALDTQNKELLATIETLKFEQTKLLELNDKYKLEKNTAQSRIQQLKTIFIDCMKEKGATDTEINIYDKLLSVW